jgi:hypothetical protein
MNTFCTVLRVSVVLVVACVSNVNGDNGSSKKFSQTLNQGFKFAVTTTHDSKFMIAGTFLADHAENSILGKAAVETAGYALDSSKCNLSDVDFENVGKHFIINYGIRRVGNELNSRGYTLDPIVNACDQLPAGVSAVVNPVVKPLIQTVTHPEALTLAALYTLNNFVIPYLESGKE